MSAAIPFQLYPVRGRTPVYVMLGVIFVIWPLMMLASNNKVAGTAEGARLVLAASAWLIIAIGALQFKGLARAREVVGRQLLPRALWRRWLRACLVETSMIWGFLATINGTLMAAPASVLPWTVAPALLSLCLCVGVVGMLAYQFMLPERLVLPAKALVGALLLAAMWLDGDLLMACLVSLPLAALVVLALAWPLVGSALTLRAGRLMEAYRRQPASASGTLLASIDSRLRRYAPLDWRNSWKWRPAPQQAGGGTRLAWLASVTFPVFFFFDTLSPLTLLRGPDVRQLVSLGLLALFMTPNLVARDLHWRLLLMPGGWRRGRIASEIFFSTLRVQLMVVAATAVAYVLIQRLLKGQPVWDALVAVAVYAPVMWEVAFAVSAALVLRALPRYHPVTIAIGIVLACCWFYLRWSVGRADLPQLRGAGMLIMMLTTAAATAVLLRVANRMWTTEKLLACARHGA